MAPTTRHSTNLAPLPITLSWLSHHKSQQSLLLQHLASLNFRELTFPSSLPCTTDARLMTCAAFLNGLRLALNLAALPGAQIWDAWLILPVEGGRPGAPNDAVGVSKERWEGLQGRLRRLEVGAGVECWFTLRELEEGEGLFEVEE